MTSHPAGIEFYGRLNFLKGGLAFSDLLTTVSRTYAREIRTAAFGNGLEGVLEERSHDLHGVINGIDYELWNPETDAALAKRYGAGDLQARAVCRTALREEMGPGRRPGSCRHVHAAGLQKGSPHSGRAARHPRHGGPARLLARGRRLSRSLHAAAPRTGRVRSDWVRRRARAGIYGGPTRSHAVRYEPCGSASIALRYGAVPIVRRNGRPRRHGPEVIPPADGTGFPFDAFAAEPLVEAVGRAPCPPGSRALERIVRNAIAETFVDASPASTSPLPQALKARANR